MVDHMTYGGPAVAMGGGASASVRFQVPAGAMAYAFGI